ncbi:MAG: MFS transporter [Clostridium sp.]|uniref:MFS transporter n=1 Tax=Clostridium sp. TaxID=1506 RepID=UPI00305049A7
MNLLKNKVFMKILITDIIQQGAIWIRNIAIMLFMMDVTNGDPIAISSLNIMEFLPMFLFTFIGGIIADKYCPKKLMLIGDFSSFISFLVLGVFIKNGYIGAIFLATLISAIVTQFSYPASQKYFKEYVDENDIDSAIGISQLLGSVFSIVGPFMGSYLYFTFGIDKTISIIAGLFLVSLSILITLPKVEFTKTEDGGFINDIKLTYNYLKKKPTLMVFTKLFFIVSFAIGISNNLDIFLVTERLGLDEKYYQFFSGIAGVGVIIGGGIYILLSKKLKGMGILYFTIGVFTVTVFFEGYSTVVWVTMLLQFVDNVIGGVLSGYIMTTITKMTDQEYLGKINGIISTTMYLGIMGGTVLSGIIVKVSSIQMAFFVASIAFAMGNYLLYNSRKKGFI